jgi:hypothetical protein
MNMDAFPSVLLAAGVSGSQLVFISLLMATTASLLLRSYRRLNPPRGRAKTGTGWGPVATPGRLREGSDPLADAASRVEVRLHDSLREAQGRLDTKIAALNQLIVDADRESARLERLLARLAGATPPVPQTAGGQRSGDPWADERAAGPPKNGRKTDAFPVPNSYHSKVYALADAGIDAPGIARRVGSGLGEIELILGLRGQRS